MRRFLIHLAIALLAFIVGVTAATIFGGFNGLRAQQHRCAGGDQGAFVAPLPPAAAEHPSCPLHRSRRPPRPKRRSPRRPCACASASPTARSRTSRSRPIRTRGSSSLRREPWSLAASSFTPPRGTIKSFVRAYPAAFRGGLPFFFVPFRGGLRPAVPLYSELGRAAVAPPY